MNEIRNDTEEIIATKQAIDKNAIETESRIVGWTAIFAPIVFFPFGIYFSIIPIIKIEIHRPTKTSVEFFDFPYRYSLFLT